VITREEGSGTLDAFLAQGMGSARIARGALVQESNGTMKEVVKRDPCAIGFMSSSLLGVGVKALAVDGVAPAAAPREGGGYPLVRPFLFVVQGTPSGAARRFLEFAQSPEAQRLIEQERMRNAASLVRGGDGESGSAWPGLRRRQG
jgi:phosphate transport system substrate-binding protein